MAKPNREPLRLAEALLLAIMAAGTGLLVRALGGGTVWTLLALAVGMFAGMAGVLLWRYATHRPLAW